MVNIVFVDDDKENAEQIIELLDFDGLQERTKICESLLEASQITSVDILVTDVSVLCPLMISMEQHAHYAICTFLARHPGTPVLILSAVPAIQDIVNDVKEFEPTAIVKGMCFEGCTKPIKDILEEWGARFK